MYIYYPSCNFSAASPATAKKVKAYFEKQMPVAGCCRVDKREISPADIALYICQACRETLEDKVKTQSMWEYLDALKDFNFPNLNGQKFYVQDCWRDRNHPEIHEAVRSLLKKMHAEVIEIEDNHVGVLLVVKLVHFVQHSEIIEQLELVEGVSFVEEVN